MRPRRVKSSFDSSDKTVKGLSSSPSASDIATVAAQTSAFVTSVKISWTPRAPSAADGPHSVGEG